VPDLSNGVVTKAAMRAAVLARRRALPAPVLADAAARVRESLSALVRRSPVGRVCAYVPVGAEPGGDALPAELASALPGDGSLLLPVLRPDLDVQWAAYEGPGSLVPAGRGLREPRGRRLGVDAVRSVDLVVVPALAVDVEGVRLGRGGGSYDRVLARVRPGIPVVALLHDGELVPAVPAQPHDRRVSGVITPAAGLVPLPGRRPLDERDGLTHH
jgi:5-formyltetrahydrofolate cyclo-ligase